MKVILFKPEIPQNTGNVIRTCAVTGTELALVKPYSFSISDRMLKRSGLDYFSDVKIEEIEDLEALLQNSNNPFYFFSSKVNKPYTQAKFTNDCFLIFGSETSGFPKHFHKKFKESFVTIPMKENARCLNLSNTVAIAIYEAKRQNNFIF